jgi:hypothetical protein
VTSIEEQWADGTPERALADAFSAFRRRDVARLAEVATSASLRALAARLGRELDASDSRIPARPTDELTDSQSASILGRILTRLPEILTDSVRCLIVGHVLDSPDVAYVVFRPGYEFRGHDVVPFPPEPQVATTQRVSGEWKLVLDERSDLGLPGFQGVGFFINPSPTTGAGTAE